MRQTTVDRECKCDFPNACIGSRIASAELGRRPPRRLRVLLRLPRAVSRVQHQNFGRKKKMSFTSSAPASARETYSSQETYYFLAIISEMDLGALLNLRRQRNQKYFLQIKEKMQELGYRWSWQQLRTHWKSLKARYNKVSSRANAA